MTIRPSDRQVKYAVRDDDGRIVSIFDADNLAEAVSFKHQIRRQLKDQVGTDQIFTVAEATQKEVRTFKAAGFIVGK